MITFNTENIAFPPIKKQLVGNWIKHIAKLHGKRVGEVNYLFCTDEKILEVNNTYLQHDYYTDIITFDYTENSCISGDIFISLDTVKSNAETYNTDYLEELHRVIIHGVLHLCGQNDLSDEEQKEMTRKENEALIQLKIES
jgi:metalloprotein, YbeY/UPF0054 family